MAMNPTNGMAAGQPGTGNPFAGRSGQVPAAQDVQGRQAPREEQAAQPIGPKQLSEATQVLLKYKSGKAALDRRIVENEHWYRLHRDTEDGNFADSGWMFNSLANKHADAMDNYPEPNVLPRARDDADTAKELSSILPVALDQNEYEQVYSDAWWYKLKHGTAVKGVFWNGAKDGGLGDIDLRLVDLLNLYWEPGITDIQASRNVFHVELVDNEVILEQWPFAKNHLGQGLTAKRYQYDESIDTSDKSLVVDWYYKRRGVLHYCKYVGECVLYASENDAQYAERGYYDHGKYPFVFDVLFPMAGSPAGFGMIDVMQSAQAAIDRLDKAIVRNADIASRVRYFARDTGSVNETEFADLDKDFVHCAGDVGEDSLRQIVVNPLADIYATILNNKISELKETSGNRDYSQGATTSGVTAASAIAALQEAGSKLSRDMLKSAYRSFAKECYLIIELMRQFYDEQRVFRVTGETGQTEYTPFSAAQLRAVPGGEIGGVQLGDHEPVFDITVSAAKKSTFSRLSQNETAKECYQMGFFAPANADAALAALDMMDFEGIEKVRQRVSENGTLYQQLQQMAQQMQKMAAIIDQQNGTNVSEAAGAAAQAAGSTGGGSGSSNVTRSTTNSLGAAVGEGNNSLSTQAAKRAMDANNPNKE